MTGSRRLFEAALSGERVVPPPVLFTGGAWVGRVSGLPRDSLLHDGAALAEAQWRVHAMVRQDALFAYFDPLFIPEAYGCGLRFVEAGPLVCPISLDCFCESAPTMRDGRLSTVLDAVGRLAAGESGHVPVGTLVEGPFTTLSRIVGAEILLRLTLTDPEVVDHALGRMTVFIAAFARAASEAGADFLFVADPVASSTMISPSMFGRFAQPALGRLCEEVPMPIMLHICGDTTPILAHMVDSGAAALSLDQCMDLSTARNSLDGRCALGGNVDPVVLLMGDTDAVARETRKVVSAGSGSGFIVMPGCGVPPGAPLENVVAMVRSARQVHL